MEKNIPQNKLLGVCVTKVNLLFYNKVSGRLERFLSVKEVRSEQSEGKIVGPWTYHYLTRTYPFPSKFLTGCCMVYRSVRSG